MTVPRPQTSVSAVGVRLYTCQTASRLGYPFPWPLLLLHTEPGESRRDDAGRAFGRKPIKSPESLNPVDGLSAPIPRFGSPEYYPISLRRIAYPAPITPVPRMKSDPGSGAIDVSSVVAWKA